MKGIVQSLNIPSSDLKADVDGTNINSANAITFRTELELVKNDGTNIPDKELFRTNADIPIDVEGAAGSISYGMRYGSIDVLAPGSVLFHGTASYPNKIGVNNAKPVSEPLTGARTADAAYTSGTAAVASILGGYGSLVNALAAHCISQHGMIYTTADHSGMFAGSLLTIRENAQFTFLAGGSSSTAQPRASYATIIAGDQCQLVDRGSTTNSGFRGFIGSSVSSTIGSRNSGMIGCSGVTLNATYSMALNVETATVTAGNHLLIGGANLTVGATGNPSYSIIWGESITNIGSRSLVLGDGHTNDHDYCNVTGTKAIAPFVGARVHGARHRGSVAGRNLPLQFQFSQETTDTTVTRLSVIGSTTYPVQPADSVISGFIIVNAVKIGNVGGEYSTFRIDFSSERVGSGTPTLRQNTTTTNYNGLALGTVPTMNVTTGGIWRVQVVGLAATNIAFDGGGMGQQTVAAA